MRSWQTVKDKAVSVLTGAVRSKMDMVNGVGVRRGRSPSGGVVENDAEDVPYARPHRADTMPHADAVISAEPPVRPMADREQNGIALRQRHDLDARLHARTLFGQHELAAGKIR